MRKSDFLINFVKQEISVCKNEMDKYNSAFITKERI